MIITVTANMARRIKAIRQSIIKHIPPQVATPLPPLKLKNQGCKEVTIDIEQSKVYNKYGYLNIRDGQGDIIQKIRIIIR